MDFISLWASCTSKQHLAKQSLKMVALVHLLVYFEAFFTLVNYVRKQSLFFGLYPSSIPNYNTTFGGRPCLHLQARQTNLSGGRLGATTLRNSAQMPFEAIHCDLWHRNRNCVYSVQKNYHREGGENFRNRLNERKYQGLLIGQVYSHQCLIKQMCPRHNCCGPGHHTAKTCS